MVVCFAFWTVLIQYVDVQPAGQTGKEVGFAAINTWFHQLTGVHMKLYTLTDWLGLVPVMVCMGFASIGFIQLVNRRSLYRVDPDILLLGGYYAVVILGYLIFECMPINYRPILIEGRLEASYPSSTTLLVLSVMPTLAFESRRRVQNKRMQQAICIFACVFSLIMVIGRLISGVHWCTDIIGAVLLSGGLFCMYRGGVILCCKEEE